MGESTERIFSVAALTRSIRKNLLANNERLAGVWIEGEVSGNKIYPSGHRYFTLKDQEAQIQCVLFAFMLNGCAQAYRDLLAQGEDKVNGLKVQVEGELDLNMMRGQYSFKVRKLRIAGEGDKMAQFNALKAKLEAEGLNKLDHPELRRKLPFLPHRIGIVTSPAGAVIHDMCTVLTRRFPNIEIRLYPVKVQGDGAVKEIVAGIDYFNQSEWVPDILIVGRGGGSVEDLWAFNEEPVVRAVAGAKVPVISAVGHESDVTLCDSVADLRAGTPSIAAERAVPVKADLVAKVRDLAARLEKAPKDTYENLVQRVDWADSQLSTLLKSVATEMDARLQRAAVRLAPALKVAAAQAEQRVQRAALKLDPLLQSRMQRAESDLAACAAKLRLLSPYDVLGRGYSITLGEDGKTVRSIEGVKSGDHVTTRFADGMVVSTVETVEKEGAA